MATKQLLSENFTQIKFVPSHKQKHYCLPSPFVADKIYFDVLCETELLASKWQVQPFFRYIFEQLGKEMCLQSSSCAFFTVKGWATRLELCSVVEDKALAAIFSTETHTHVHTYTNTQCSIHPKAKWVKLISRCTCSHSLQKDDYSGLGGWEERL